MQLGNCEPGNSLEVTVVAGGDCAAKIESSRPDQQLSQSHGVSLFSAIGVDECSANCDWLVEGLNGKGA